MSRSILLVKILLIASIGTAIVVDGFTVIGGSRAARPVNVRLNAAAVDAASAIAAAAAASKQYGPTSPEARVAWDIVEELNSADNSAAIGGSLNDECELDETVVSAACIEYGEKLDELQAILAQSTPIVQKVKNIAADLKAIKMTVAKAKPAARSPAVTAALEAAKATAAEFGADSAEARVAWAELEEIASSGLENAMGPVLDSGNCAIESSIEACEALEEVNRVLSM